VTSGAEHNSDELSVWTLRAARRIGISARTLKERSTGSELYRDANETVSTVRIHWRGKPPAGAPWAGNKLGYFSDISAAEIEPPKRPPAPEAVPDMSPTAFLALQRAASNFVRVAKAIGVSESELANHPFRLVERMEGTENCFYIFWDDQPPRHVGVDEGGATRVEEHTEPSWQSLMPDVIGISKEQQKQAIDFINGKAIDPNDPCPVCGGTQGLAPFLMENRYGITPLGFVIPFWTAVTVCDDCGYIRHFMSKTVGLDVDIEETRLA